MDELLRYAKKLLLRAILFPLCLFPVKKNRVLLCNDLSKKYADNPKVVCEYLLPINLENSISFSRCLFPKTMRI